MINNTNDSDNSDLTPKDLEEKQTEKNSQKKNIPAPPPFDTREFHQLQPQQRQQIQEQQILPEDYKLGKQLQDLRHHNNENRTFINKC